MPNSIDTSNSWPGARDTNEKLAEGLVEAVRRRTQAEMRGDLPAYAAKCLMIRTKSGEGRPPAFHPAPRPINEQPKPQHAPTGTEPGPALHGRQQGSST